MKVVTAAEMQEIDRRAIEEFGIPPEVLMFNAGKATADYISQSCGDPGSAAVFCGTGNNGGDGFVISYLLASRRWNITIYLSGKIEKITPTSLIYCELCSRCGIEIIEIHDAAEASRLADPGTHDIIVDALTGTGFTGEARGVTGELIRLINSSGKKIISVDLPSGLPSDGNAPEGDAVAAHATVTMGLPKISLAVHPGASLAGDVIVADIGFPRRLIESDILKAGLIDRFDVMPVVGRRPSPDLHKGDAGRLLLLGGFDGMEGAIMMSAMAALECGVGIISLVTTERARGIIAGRIPELITASLLDLPDEGPGIEDHEIISRLDRLLKRYDYDVVLLGPGMGRGGAEQKIFLQVMKRLGEYPLKGLVIDGDGLFHLAACAGTTVKLPEGKTVITPHFREASRLLGVETGELKKKRFQAALDLANRLGATALLKGPSTIVSDGIRSCINTTGNPALATGGSGDVLSGIIASFMLRSGPLDSACAGAYVHGLAADLYCSEHGTARMKATDIIGHIKKTVAHIMNPGEMKE